MEKYFLTYGTLKRNHGNHHLLQAPGVEFIGNVETEPNYTLFDGGFPVVERGGNTSIKGELYKVTNPEVVNRVNALEGYSGERGHESNWYDTDEVVLANGIVADMFVMDKGQSGRTAVVESGQWR
jgi:gamma-glutamylcyclotransferase (GGCT)/AIG2-like uncharacterized protein YtfP